MRTCNGKTLHLRHKATPPATLPRQLLPHNLHHVFCIPELGEDFVQFQVGGGGEFHEHFPAAARFRDEMWALEQYLKVWRD